jgi:hypothetical protein
LAAIICRADLIFGAGSRKGPNRRRDRRATNGNKGAFWPLAVNGRPVRKCDRHHSQQRGRRCSPGDACDSDRKRQTAGRVEPPRRHFTEEGERHESGAALNRRAGLLPTWRRPGVQWHVPIGSLWKKLAGDFDDSSARGAGPKPIPNHSKEVPAEKRPQPGGR